MENFSIAGVKNSTKHNKKYTKSIKPNKHTNARKAVAVCARLRKEMGAGSASTQFKLKVLLEEAGT